MTRISPLWLWTGALVGCSIAVFALPEARRHAFDGACYGINVVPDWQRATALTGDPRMRPEISVRAPLDFESEVGLATLSPVTVDTGNPEAEIRVRIARLADVLARHPDRREIYAHLARYYAGLVRLGRDPQPPEDTDDWNNLLSIASTGHRAEPTNAFFPQMMAAAHLGLGHREQARSAWILASRLLTWRGYAETEIFDQWQLLEEAFGRCGPRQLYASIGLLRLPHISLIQETAMALLQPSAHPDREIRRATARNGALVRREARQVVSGVAGIRIVEWAIQADPPKLRPMTPKQVEEGRGRFIQSIADDPAYVRYAQDQARANDAYLFTIVGTSAIEFSGSNAPGRPATWSGWLFRSTAFGALTDGAAGLATKFLALFLFAQLILWAARQWRAYVPERLRGVLALGVALVTGSIAFLGSDLWPIGAYYALLVGGLCYAAAATDVGARPPAAGTDFILWSRGAGLLSYMVIALAFVVSSYAYVFRYAAFPDVHRALTGLELPAISFTTPQWSVIAWMVGSLPLAISVVWAASSGRPLIPAAAEGLSRISLRGVGACAALFLISLPITIHFDRQDEQRLKIIARHEPNYYRRSSPGYHEPEQLNP